MDVTPSKKMYEAMTKMTDAFCGPEPSRFEASSRADAVRAKRRGCMDLLHALVGLSMREGVNRAVRDAQARKAGLQDGEDRDAVARAVADATQGAHITQLPGMERLG